MKPADSGGSGYRIWSAVFFSGLAAFLIRSLPWRNFLDLQGGYLFYGPDCYDHLRRITLGIASFPHIPVFDAYYGYPIGTGLIWSPFFDYLITILAVGGGGSTSLVHSLGFWLSPVLGALTLIPLYCYVHRLFGPWPAVVAAGMLAVLPGHILYTLVSELDHHAVEPLLALALLMSLSGWRPNRPHRAVPPWLMTAFWFVAAVLLWRGSVLFWGIGLAGLMLHVVALRTSDRPASSLLADWAIRLCLAAALMLTPFCLLFGEATGGGIKFGVVSWFHVVFLVVAGGLFRLARSEQGGLWRRTPVLVIILAIVAIGLGPGNKFLHEFLRGLVVVGRGDPWLDSISELRSMLFPGHRFSVSHSLEMLSGFYWAAPLLLWHAWRQWRQGTFCGLPATQFLSWCLTLWLLPLLRERYVHLAAIPVAALTAYGVWACADLFVAKRHRAVIRTAVAAGVVTMLLPLLPFLRQLPALGLPEYERTDLMAVMRYLREATPRTSWFDAPNHRPEYGVLAGWGLGAYINYLGQRPTVATNFGWETHGLYESAMFLTESDPAAAELLLRENGVRYLLLDGVETDLYRLRAIAEQRRAIQVSRFQPLTSMYFRLYVQDGSDYAVQQFAGAGLGTYRLVYESAGSHPEQIMGTVSNYKLFERVAGAVLTGMGRPGESVRFELPLRSGAGRSFVFRASTTVGSNREFTLRIPYATNENSGDVLPEAPGRLQIGARVVAPVINGQDVLAGKTLRISF